MKKSNVFFILCDELRADTLGFTGNRAIRTPNIDQLAEDSVIVENCYCACPMCVPSRVSLATGRHCLSHGTLDNSMSPMEDEISLYDVFRKYGYRTLNYGKWHANQEAGRFGFDKSINRIPLSYPEKHVGVFGITDKELRIRTEYKKNEGEIPLIISGKRPTCEDETYDSLITGLYISRLDDIRSVDTPFFHRLSIHDPHTPYIPAEPYASMYKPEDMEMPASLFEDLSSKPLTQRFYRRARGFEKLTENDYRKSKASYYGLVSNVDSRVGRVIKRLKELGLYDDAIVVFTSDHGSMMGEHGFIEKWGHMYEPVVKVPLLIKFPHSEFKGSKCGPFAENIDILPTLLDCLGMEIPEAVQGKSMMKSIRGDRPHKQEVFSLYMSGSLMKEPALMVRDMNWKLTLYPEQQSIEERLYPDHPLKYTGFFDRDLVEGELYNMEKDPGEQVNLFDDEQYKEIRKKYVSKLQKWKNSLGMIADYSKLTSFGKGRFLSFRLHEGDNLAKAADYFSQAGYTCKCERTECLVQE